METLAPLPGAAHRHYLKCKFFTEHTTSFDVSAFYNATQDKDGRWSPWRKRAREWRMGYKREHMTEMGREYTREQMKEQREREETYKRVLGGQYSQTSKRLSWWSCHRRPWAQSIKVHPLFSYRYRRELWAKNVGKLWALLSVLWLTEQLSAVDAKIGVGFHPDGISQALHQAKGQL